MAYNRTRQYDLCRYYILSKGFPWFITFVICDCRKGSHDLLLMAYAIDLHCLGSSLLWYLFIPMTFDTAPISLLCSNILCSDNSYEFQYSLLWYSAIFLRYVNSSDISLIFHVNSFINTVYAPLSMCSFLLLMASNDLFAPWLLAPVSSQIYSASPWLHIII